MPRGKSWPMKWQITNHPMVYCKVKLQNKVPPGMNLQPPKGLPAHFSSVPIPHTWRNLSSIMLSFLNISTGGYVPYEINMIWYKLLLNTKHLWDEGPYSQKGSSTRWAKIQLKFSIYNCKLELILGSTGASSLLWIPAKSLNPGLTSIG